MDIVPTTLAPSWSTKPTPPVAVCNLIIGGVPVSAVVIFINGKYA